MERDTGKVQARTLQFYISFALLYTYYMYKYCFAIISAYNTRRFVLVYFFRPVYVTVLCFPS